MQVSGQQQGYSMKFTNIIPKNNLKESQCNIMKIAQRIPIPSLTGFNMNSCSRSSASSMFYYQDPPDGRKDSCGFTQESGCQGDGGHLCTEPYLCCWYPVKSRWLFLSNIQFNIICIVPNHNSILFCSRVHRYTGLMPYIIVEHISITCSRKLMLK